MDKLAAMRALVEIVDRGSLTKAGESLGKSLPTMVRTLAALEASLGVRLLVRTTRRMSLTPEGRDYLERSRRILADVAEAEDVLVAGQAEPQGELKITAPVLFGQMHVAPGLIRFAAAFPRITVDLTLLDRVVDLVEEGFDAGIRLAPLEDSSMVAIGVGEVTRVVVASPELLERTGTPDHPDMLGDQACVLFSGTAPAGIWSFQAEGRDLRVDVAGKFRTNHASVALDACVQGLGFGQFLSYQVAPLIQSGKLIPILQSFSRPAVPVSVVYPNARLVSTRLRAFLDWMRDDLRPQTVV